MSHSRVTRILLHPQTDERLLDQVAGILETAFVNHPEKFDKVKDQPSIVDHYGYHTDTLSAVVLSKESEPSLYYRLTIRRDEHEVFDHLAALIADHMGIAPH